jgi:nucleoside-diphosphate-sugar epimerase
VYGEGEAENRLWPSLRRAALDGSDYLLTPGEQLRDFVPVELVAEKLLEASANIETVPGLASIYNIGTGTPQSIKSFAEYWWAQWKAKGRLRVGAIQYRENEVMRYVPEVNMN